MQFQETINLGGGALLEIAFDKGGHFASPFVARFHRIVGAGLFQFDGLIDEFEMLAKHGILVIGIADIGMGMADQIDALDF